MGSTGGPRVILAVCLALHVLLGCTEYLPPPTNITFGMNGMFFLQWRWAPPENKLNCSLKYTKIIVPRSPKQKGICAYFEECVEKFGILHLNSEIIFEVQAECNNSNITSEPVRVNTRLAAGDNRTSVRNFTCVWYYQEYVNCTWQPGEDQPPNVNYSLLYWIRDGGCLQYQTQINNEKDCVRARQPTQFHQLLDTGKHCESYTHSNEIPVGCQFQLHKPFTDFSWLVMVVTDTDRSKNVKPYISYIHVNHIAKLKPPAINSVSRTQNQSIYLSWNASDVHQNSLYEVQLEMSNGEKLNFKDFSGVSKEIPNVLPDITYTVKVRVRLPGHATDSYLWSDWSEEKTLPGKDGGRTTSIILLFLIPLIVVVATVILLIYMRRLQILIFPRIPDPGKVLSNDLQQWIKNGRSVYDEPKKEEICQVSLLETPVE
ncbi:interleukin-13 receptor subunit alpha-1-like [Pseudophryne corroboree]|uniref:interleukin-13 receptor subunit alpha-1-like n=1 Tax=Pseudophryne corroboree TaxID=495146 RepID=UPI0030817A01